MIKSENMNVLVTGGATGFIGSHMTDLLIQQGYNVTITTTNKLLSKKSYLNPPATVVYADLTDQKSVLALFSSGKTYDYVFHTAAIYDYSALQDTLDKVNVDGTYNLLTAVKKFSPSAVIVVWGSGAVYGNTGENVAVEETPLKPKNNYERSKAKQEETALSFSDDLKIVVIRPAAVYGPRSMYGAAVPLFMIANGQIPCIIGTGKTPAFLVHVVDVVRSALFLAENYNTVNAKIKTGDSRTKFVFNVNDDSLYSFEEIFYWVEKCLHEAGRTDVKLLHIRFPLWLLKPIIWINTRWAKKTGKRPPIEQDLVDYLTCPIVMSNKKIKSLGFHFRYPDAKIGIKETISWYINQGLL